LAQGCPQGSHDFLLLILVAATFLNGSDSLLLFCSLFLGSNDCVVSSLRNQSWQCDYPSLVCACSLVPNIGHSGSTSYRTTRTGLLRSMRGIIRNLFTRSRASPSISRQSNQSSSQFTSTSRAIVRSNSTFTHTKGKPFDFHHFLVIYHALSSLRSISWRDTVLTPKNSADKFTATEMATVNTTERLVQLRKLMKDYKVDVYSNFFMHFSLLNAC
jgi:hypothetical protein